MVDYSKEIIKISNKLGLSAFSNYEQFYNKDGSFLENLHNILKNQEIESRERIIDRRIKLAQFPRVKTFDQFLYDEINLPQLNYDSTKNLKDCGFIKNKQDIVMIGPPGKGKTHLAIALGVEAIKNNYSVRFFTANKMITKLEESKTKNAFGRFLGLIRRIDLLIIDEIGYIKFEEDADKYLFDVISERYEQKSTIITTNYPLDQWGNFSWNQYRTHAVVDRLTHHSIILDMTGGDSYRVRNSLSGSK
jgi:DNA replication protein DnaC